MKRKIYKILFACLSLLILTIPITIPRSIKINEVLCKNQYGECKKETLESLSSLNNRSYTSARKSAKILFNSDPSITTYKISYKLPGKLLIEINEKKPKYSITGNDKKIYSYIDQEGNVIGTGDSSPFPTIVSLEELPQKGTKVKSKMIFALKLMNDIDTLYQVREGKLENDSLVIELPSNLRVIFPLEGEREVLIGSLVLLYGEITKDGQSRIEFNGNGVKLVDLRYKNPILKTL